MVDLIVTYGYHDSKPQSRNELSTHISLAFSASQCPDAVAPAVLPARSYDHLQSPPYALPSPQPSAHREES